MGSGNGAWRAGDGVEGGNPGGIGLAGGAKSTVVNNQTEKKAKSF